jgi:hypothetical protein
MPRIYLSARGEPVDFDAVLIKQKLAQAPMDIEVARRKSFIDSKEEKPQRRASIPEVTDQVLDNEVSVTNTPTYKVVVPTDAEAIAAVSTSYNFEPETQAIKSTDDYGPIPNLPERSKK